MHLAALNAEYYTRATTPATTNPANPPHAMLNLYDPDDDEFFSEPGDDGGVAAYVTDAIGHHQQLEAERLADAAHQVQGHLESVAQQQPLHGMTNISSSDHPRVRAIRDTKNKVAIKSRGHRNPSKTF